MLPPNTASTVCPGASSSNLLAWRWQRGQHRVGLGATGGKHAAHLKGWPARRGEHWAGLAALGASQGTRGSMEGTTCKHHSCHCHASPFTPPNLSFQAAPAHPSHSQRFRRFPGLARWAATPWAAPSARVWRRRAWRRCWPAEPGPRARRAGSNTAHRFALGVVFVWPGHISGLTFLDSHALAERFDLQGRHSALCW